jgi:peptide chain release factor subunit 1
MASPCSADSINGKQLTSAHLPVPKLTAVWLFGWSSVQKQVLQVLECSQPIGSVLYRCDKVFYTAALREHLASSREPAYGLVVIDGHGGVFARLQGTAHSVVHSWRVDLPNKHSKGGQSSVRFSRQRV